ncbi:hypothetical protein [Desulfonatronovibrio hydrogenovorans]|uniref:hypothetical protein n=1 Tax=Desulfonatronovibrio hydrogenovorans TaxID=53245 RepID=UPI00129473CA|nr:hypothetical protein [Desulfonatronovibrio hydrogenovorans]
MGMAAVLYHWSGTAETRLINGRAVKLLFDHVFNGKLKHSLFKLCMFGAVHWIKIYQT